MTLVLRTDAATETRASKLQNGACWPWWVPAQGTPAGWCCPPGLAA